MGAWLNVLAGVLLVIAPFALGYRYHDTVETARNTDVVMGIAVALIALVSRFYVSPMQRQKATG